MPKRANISKKGLYSYIVTDSVTKQGMKISESSNDQARNRLEDYEPGANRQEVFDALKRTVQPKQNN